MSNTLCWTDIPVIELDRAIAFYSSVLAAPVVKQAAGPGVEFGLLPGFDRGASGCLVKGENQVPSHHGPLIYLSVDGRLDAAIQAVIDGRGRVVTPKHAIGLHGFRAIIEDTEGNRLALHSQTA